MCNDEFVSNVVMRDVKEEDGRWKMDGGARIFMVEEIGIVVLCGGLV